MTAPLELCDLTIPEPGSRTAKEVLSRALTRLGRELLGAPRSAPLGAQREAVELGRLLQGAMRSAQGAVLSALRRPTVGALVRCLRDPTLPGRERVFTELAAELAFELALAGALPAPVRVRAPSRLLSIAGRVSIALPKDAKAVVLENGRVRVERASGSVVVSLADLPLGEEGGVVVSRPYHSITGAGAGEIVLAWEDNNPLAMVEAHPDKEGNAIDLGGHSAAAWGEALGEAFALVERYLPELWGEMELFLHQVVPVGFFEQKHLSASYQEAIGTIYCSLHPQRMTLTEALIHEFSHNKLNALFELDPVLENAFSPLYASPVRPDPRPLHGVLLAVHAFLPVARLYERMIEQGDPLSQNEAFRGRYAAIRRINREGAEVLLTNGRATRVGAMLLEEIRRWDAHYARVDVAT